MSLSIVAEVIKAIEIAKTVSYKPLADKILMSCIDVLKELQVTGEKAPQVCSEYEFRQTMLPQTTAMTYSAHRQTYSGSDTGIWLTSTSLFRLLTPRQFVKPPQIFLS
jgi:hypothetical protein